MSSKQSSEYIRRLGEILGVAAVYFIAGRAALLLAIPPGYATAIWPAAGLASAAVQPKDINRLVAAGQPVCSPDGTLIAYVVSRVDEAENTYRSQVWLAAADGSTSPEPFSNGEHSDGNPTWSPDGRRLAFTSRREDKKSTLHVRPVAGGGEMKAFCAARPAIGVSFSAR
jgi:hypothetical protein